MYSCKVCNKTFARKECLSAHEPIHSNIRFPCSICGKNYSSYANLRRHDREGHRAVPRNRSSVKTVQVSFDVGQLVSRRDVGVNTDISSGGCGRCGETELYTQKEFEDHSKVCDLSYPKITPTKYKN